MVIDSNEFENSAGTALDAATNLQLKGDIQGAETAYKSLINAGSTQAPVYSNLATIHLERKELHAAIELYERAITLQPDLLKLIWVAVPPRRTLAMLRMRSRPLPGR